jgi:hypothetical protein
MSHHKNNNTIKNTHILKILKYEIIKAINS